MNLRLKELRKANGLRQEDLAVAIMSTPRVVGAWERGETPLPLEDACLIADVFNCTLDELAGRDFPAGGEPALATDEAALVGSYRLMDAENRARYASIAPTFVVASEKDGEGDSADVERAGRNVTA